jgi:maltose/moltooligosaccharide transporter
VRNAVCDVLVVQTSALDEDRLFAAEHPDATGADVGGPSSRTDTADGAGGAPPTV